MNTRDNSIFSITVIVALASALLFAGPLTINNSVFANNDEQPTGNAAFEIEQVADPNAFSPECFAEIDAAIGDTATIVFNERPEIAEAIDTEAQEIASETEAPAEVSTQLDDVVVELEANNSEVAEAVEAVVTPEEVVVVAAENAIVDEIIELNPEAEAAIDATIADGVTSVVTGEATAEEASVAVEANVTAIVDGIEVTPEDVQEAAGNVQSEGAVVDELGGDGSESAANATVPSKEDVPVAEPSKEDVPVAEPSKEDVPAKEDVPVKEDAQVPVEPQVEEPQVDQPVVDNATEEVAPEVPIVVEETIEENAEEIAEEAGIEVNTLLGLIEQAQANLDAARALIS
jgi:hypothetical protein